MSVWLAYRSPYQGIAGKAVRRFDDDTVLGWFRSRWNDLAYGPGVAPSVPQEDADFEALRAGVRARVEKALGCTPSGLVSLFRHAAEQGWVPPKTDAQLRKYVEDSLDTWEGGQKCE